MPEPARPAWSELDAVNRVYEANERTLEPLMAQLRADGKPTTKGSTAKLVLIALVRAAGNRRQCWCGYEHIAAFASVRRDAVAKALRALEASGLVTWERRNTHAGRRPWERTNLYTIHGDRVLALRLFKDLAEERMGEQHRRRDGAEQGQQGALFGPWGAGAGDGDGDQNAPQGVETLVGKPDEPAPKAACSGRNTRRVSRRAAGELVGFHDESSSRFPTRARRVSRRELVAFPDDTESESEKEITCKPHVSAQARAQEFSDSDSAIAAGRRRARLRFDAALVPLIGSLGPRHPRQPTDSPQARADMTCAETWFEQRFWPEGLPAPPDLEVRLARLETLCRRARRHPCPMGWITKALLHGELPLIRIWPPPEVEVYVAAEGR